MSPLVQKVREGVHFISQKLKPFLSLSADMFLPILCSNAKSGVKFRCRCQNTMFMIFINLCIFIVLFVYIKLTYLYLSFYAALQSTGKKSS